MGEEPHDHPLLPSETFSRSGRPIATPLASARPIASYFDLKSQSEARTAGFAQSGSGSASIRSNGDYDGVVTPRSTSASKPGTSHDAIEINWRRGSQAEKNPPVRPAMHFTSTCSGEVSSDTSAPDILRIPWDRLDDDSILSLLNTPSAMIEVIRVLYQREEDLSKRYEELQSLRSLEAGRESRARLRVKNAMRSLQPSERDVARRVLESVFSDESDEGPTSSGVNADFVSRPMCC